MRVEHSRLDLSLAGAGPMATTSTILFHSKEHNLIEKVLNMILFVHICLSLVCLCAFAACLSWCLRLFLFLASCVSDGGGKDRRRDKVREIGR